MAKRLFAVIRSRGDAWEQSRPLEAQEDWPAHADFMNALEKEGFVLLGGPLQGTGDALLIFRAQDEDEIISRLEPDPWTRKRLLRIRTITPWDLRLGSLA
jgi:uncharacterized protein YciI